MTSEKNDRSDDRRGGHDASVIVKIIEHRDDLPDNQKQVKSQRVGGVEILTVAEVLPVITQREGSAGISSRPERAPVVVRIIAADPSLNASTDERRIKRERLSDIVIERVDAAFVA